MVRTLSGTLTTAVNAKTRIPSVGITCEDHIQHYSVYQSPAATDRYHDAVAANDGSIVRVSVTRGGTGFDQNFQRQRVTAPGTAGQWTSWTTFTGGSGNCFQDGGCAISNNAGTLRAFVQRGTGGNNLWVWSSTDNGVTWTGPVSVLSPPGGAQCKGIGSAGNNDVFFLYDQLGGDGFGASFFSGGVWGPLKVGTIAPFSYAFGMDVVFSSIYYLFATDGYALYEFTYNAGSDTWSTLPQIAPAATTEVGRLSPRISFDSINGIYNLCCVDSNSGSTTWTPLSSCIRLRQSKDLLHWSSGYMFYDITTTYSGVIVHSSAVSSNLLITMPTIEQSLDFSSGNATQYLDVSASILSYKRYEYENKPAKLEILLDNNKGVLSPSVGTNSTYEPINLNTSVVVNEGYKTGSPPTTPEKVKIGTYHVNQIHFLRSPHENAIKLTCYDLSRNLDTINRFQNTYTSQTISYLVKEMCARAGLFNLSLPVTTQMSNVVPTFILRSSQTYRKSLNELCDVYQLDYFMDENEQMVFKEKGADASVWTYQPEVEIVSFGNDDLRANHTVVTGKSPTGGVAGTILTSESYDTTNMHLVGIERIIHQVDSKLTTLAETLLKANFLMSQEQRAQTAHQFTVPSNPALQILDVVTLTDYNAPTGSSQSGTARILELETEFTPQHAIYELIVRCEGV
jgi:hypothetical protein